MEVSRSRPLRECVCMSVCLCVCMPVCATCVLVDRKIRVCVDICMHTYMDTCMPVLCWVNYMLDCIFAYIYIYNSCLYAYDTCRYIHVDIRTYIHTYIHIQCSIRRRRFRGVYRKAHAVCEWAHAQGHQGGFDVSLYACMYMHVYVNRLTPKATKEALM